jgi:hypothetical protein
MAANAPPPLPPPVPPSGKKTSPIVWVLLALAGFFVFAVVAIAALGFFVYHKAKHAGFDVALLEKKPELAFVKMAVAANPDAELVSIDEDRGVVSVRDKKTGKVVTLNFADIRKGKMTFEEDGKKVTIQGQASGNQGGLEVTSPEGTAKIGAGAVKLPAWFPSYSGANAEGFSSESANGSTGGFGFKTNDSAEKATAFYEDELKKAGFTVEVTKHAAGAILSAQSGARKAVINILADGTGASVNGTFEDK